VHFQLLFMSSCTRSIGSTLPGSKKTHGHALYEQFRCGLAHGLTIEGREITTRPSRYIHDNSGHESIDLWSLSEEMRRALDRYVTKVHTDKGTQHAFFGASINCSFSRTPRKRSSLASWGLALL